MSGRGGKTAPGPARLAAVLPLALAALLGLAACAPPRGAGDEPGAPPAGEGAGAEAEAGGRGEGDATPEAGADRREVVVLFASPSDDLLHGQTREIFWTASVDDRALQTLVELIEGPAGGLLPVLPAAARVRELYVMPDGTAVADFSRDIVASRGSASERAAIYAIVNTLALNFPEIRRVAILVEGEQAETLSGHLDARFPFAPDARLVEPGLVARLSRPGAVRE